MRFMLHSLSIDKLSQVHIKALKNYVQFLVLYFNAFGVNDIGVMKYLEDL
jgi:hypothetical protein